jgi:hypothetical protein
MTLEEKCPPSLIRLSLKKWPVVSMIKRRGIVCSKLLIISPGHSGRKWVMSCEFHQWLSVVSMRKDTTTTETATPIRHSFFLGVPDVCRNQAIVRLESSTEVKMEAIGFPACWRADDEASHSIDRSCKNTFKYNFAAEHPLDSFHGLVLL